MAIIFTKAYSHDWEQVEGEGTNQAHEEQDHIKIYNQLSELIFVPHFYTETNHTGQQYKKVAKHLKAKKKIVS